LREGREEEGSVEGAAGVGSGSVGGVGVGGIGGVDEEEAAGQEKRPISDVGRWEEAEIRRPKRGELDVLKVELG